MKGSERRQQLLVLLALFCVVGVAHPFSISQEFRQTNRPSNSRTFPNVRTQQEQQQPLPLLSRRTTSFSRSSVELKAISVLHHYLNDLVPAKEALQSTATTLAHECGNLIKQCSNLALLFHPESIIESSTKTDLLPLPYGDVLLQLQQHHPNLLLAEEAVQSGAKNLLDSYRDWLNQYPISTKSITACILACMGDAIAQYRSGEKYDVKRGLAFMGFGALYTGAFQHAWFTYLQLHAADWGVQLGIWGPSPEQQQHIAAVMGNPPLDLTTNNFKAPPSPSALAAGKLMINQFLMVPLVYMPLFLAMTGALAGLDWKASYARGQYLYVSLLQRNWLFWLPTQFLQFLVIPVDFQIPFLSVASLVWTIILSTLGAGATKTESIVVYDEEPNGKDNVVVTVRQVMPGAANQITDDVRWEDLVEAVPWMAANMTSDLPRASYATGGFATTVLLTAAAAADEGSLLGQTVAQVLGSSPTPDVSVAVVTAAVGARMGLAVAGYMTNNTASGVDAMAVEQETRELLIQDS